MLLALDSGAHSKWTPQNPCPTTDLMVLEMTTSPPEFPFPVIFSWTGIKSFILGIIFSLQEDISDPWLWWFLIWLSLHWSSLLQSFSTSMSLILGLTPRVHLKIYAQLLTWWFLILLPLHRHAFISHVVIKLLALDSRGHVKGTSQNTCQTCCSSDCH